MEVHPNIEFHTNIYNPEFKIPPMILQPMVENAFKHSRLENNRDGYVKITINQKDSNFEFITENSQSTFMNNNKERSGIGIANVRKRLDLVFGNNYKLLIDNNDKYYKVELKVNVKNNI